eukprot:1675409-Rhodomonas_salina.2
MRGCVGGEQERLIVAYAGATREVKVESSFLPPLVAGALPQPILPHKLSIDICSRLACCSVGGVGDVGC